MGRDRNSLRTRVLSYALSLVLTAGLVPAPALAEAIDEAAPTEEQAITVVQQDDSGAPDALQGDDEGRPAIESDDATAKDDVAQTIEVSRGQVGEETALEAEEDGGTRAADESDTVEGVTYIEHGWEDGKVTTTEITAESMAVLPKGKTLVAGEYYLNEDVTVDGRVSLTGDTSIVLGDGHTYDVKGIYVPKGCTLKVYAQSEGEGTNPGRIYSHPSDGAAIGAYSGHKGGIVEVHGGQIEAEGHDHCAGIGSNDDDRTDVGSFVMYGGDVTATGGGSGAGIGGGRACEGGVITIYGGKVTAEGGHYGAGIGGGNGQDKPVKGAHGGTITIWGGTVTATGGDDAAGIGGGEGGNAGTIAIHGGTVTAEGGDNASGIGCGEGESTGYGGSVTIDGGTVTATGDDDGAGIGGGEDGYCDSIDISGGRVTANGGRQAAAIGGGSNADSGKITIKGGRVTANANSYRGKGIGSGYDSGDSTPITLGYTDATKDDVSITASSYNGIVTLEQGFKNDHGMYQAGSTPDLSKLASGTLRAWDGQMESWAQLQARINVAENGDIIKLEQSYKATSAESSLSVTSSNGASREVTIDLNGYTLDRNLGSVRSDGSAVFVGDGAKLTIKDSAGGGVITGGRAEDGGGVYCQDGGTLAIDGGTISGNEATRGGGVFCSGSTSLGGGSIKGNTATSGGGVYCEGAIVVHSGSIARNSAKDGGGIYLHGGRDLTLGGGSITGNTCGTDGDGGGVWSDINVCVSGDPEVYDNRKGGSDSNIKLTGDRKIEVVGDLSEPANLSVSPADYEGGISGAITMGYDDYSGGAPAHAYFGVDAVGYATELRDGEVWIVPAEAVTETNVRYVERSWTGGSVSSESKTRDVAVLVPDDGAMTSGWYYLKKSVKVNRRISLTGDTYLILGNGCTLDVKGLYIPQGKRLRIYAQSDGESAGKLISKPSGGAAIGATGDNHPGGEIIIHGGSITAKGADHCAGIGSNDGNGTTSPITIYGGVIDAHGGGDGAGIGGGRNCDGGTIAIYGGEITAHGGGENGAGIGGGDSSDGGNITIWGGTLTCNKDPNEDGAAIGGGDDGDGGNVTINGGTITCWSRDGACIGGGDDGDGGTITINGGEITCNDKGAAQGARIGGGSDGDGGTITINEGTVHVWFRDGAGVGGGEDGDSGDITINGGAVISKFAEGSAGNAAAIGGGNHSGDGDRITISGGDVVARSNHGAGIGGGRMDDKIFNKKRSGEGGTIRITGGKVSASSEYSFGIGAGDLDDDSEYVSWYGDCGHVTVCGDAHVTASGKEAGIGGFEGTVNIQGGTVIAKGEGYDGGKCGRGIYFWDTGGRLNITGGNVTAIGYEKNPGISTEYATVNITGGTVDASSEEGYAIGGLYDDSDKRNGKLTIMGADTVVHVRSEKFLALGDFKKVTYGPGITVEIISGRRDGVHFSDLLEEAKIDYKGMKVTAGKNMTSARILPEGNDFEHFGDINAHNAYKEKEFKYLRYEPCDHKDLNGESLEVDGGCWACGQYDSDTLKYVECSWDETANKVVKTERELPQDWNEFPGEDGDWTVTLGTGCYVLSRNLTVGQIVLTGNAKLILCDGFELFLALGGVEVPEGCTLSIYGQSAGTGTLVAEMPYSSARWGIHNLGNVIVHGGTIRADGCDDCAGIGSADGEGGKTGNFTMYDGTVTANGGERSAGIGGGGGCDGGTIKIYGGNVTATGKDSSAGIGGGDPSNKRPDTSTIEIHGGNVTATGDSKGAGIGGGEYGSATVSITGGEILATGGESGGAGIGSGVDGAGSDITIRGGSVTAVRGKKGAGGIGDGKNTPAESTSTITFGYTDETKEDISVTADSYRGVVTLEKPFCKGSTLFRANETPDLGAMAGGALLAWDGADFTTWKGLQNLIDGAGEGQVIKLWHDITAQDGDIALKVANSKDITIDLNGHTLDRNLGDRQNTPDVSNTLDGSALVVAQGASLTIEDDEGDGTITGGFGVSKGGGVYCEGTLTVNGGRITGNRSNYYGAGIYLAENTGATLHLNGGSITGNTYVNRTNEFGYSGGGVHVSRDATMTVSGDPVVMGNTGGSGYTVDNVTLAHGAKIEVAGELGGRAEIGVSLLPSSGDPVGTFTTGYGKYNEEMPNGYFHSDKDQYSIVTASEGGYIEGRIDTPASGVTYLSYRWGDDGLDESVNTTENVWMPWPGGTTIPGGMYVLSEDVTESKRVNLQDNTWLILCDDCTLDARGLYIPKGKTLTVYGQAGGTGKIVSSPSGGTGIGAYSGHKGGDLVVHGGTIEATGNDHCAGIGSNDGDGVDAGGFTMYHGTVTATGGSNGAGIGGGRECDAGAIVIYGGEVTATGKDDSAGIGGGDSDNSSHGNASDIRIYGGNVTATCSGRGAAIGGADYGTANVTIEGGEVNATCTGGGKGIGGGSKKEPDESTIKLGWTSWTRDDIAITASSFGGVVTLEDYFRNDSNLFNLQGAVNDNAVLSEGTLRAWDGTAGSWGELQWLMDVCERRTVIKLSDNIKAEAEDTCLDVAAGKQIELDLNGHTIDRNIVDVPAAVEGGEAIRVEEGATLTLYDASKEGGGTVTNGFTDSNGGGVLNHGTLYLEDVTITRNAAKYGGGGVYNDGELYVSGKTRVTDNGARSLGANILLASGPLNVSGTLDGDARLGVTLVEGGKSVAGTVTSGLPGKGSAKNFTCEDLDHVVALNEDGEAEIVEADELFDGIEYYMSIALKDSIDVNLYVQKLPEGTVPSDYSVHYWVGGENVREVALTSMSSNYVNLAALTARQMSEPIYVEVYYANRSYPIKVVEDCGIRRYCDDKIDDADAPQKLRDLCQAALDYGTMAQVHFKYLTDDLANANHGEGTEAAIAATTVPREYAASGEEPSAEFRQRVESVSASVSLESRVTVNLYVKPAAGTTAEDIAVTVGGVEAGRTDAVSRRTLDDGRVLVQVTGISARNLDKRLEVEVSAGGASRTIGYSPLSYAYSKQGVAKDRLGDTCKALYNYWKAASEYLG